MLTKEVERHNILVWFGIAVTAVGCIAAVYAYILGNVTTMRYILALTACMWVIAVTFRITGKVQK